ncbi:MAG: hypothetical protein A2Z35_01015 [Actinobacteria bacterium RBG_19FT_COMBO_36_27]|nr:MAG: hypothetical protein A2Z35_01015 [Actinobacteria bacterium RBG_19FT_COMBO_36_27]
MIVRKKILSFILIILAVFFYGCGLYYDYDKYDTGGETTGSVGDNNSNIKGSGSRTSGDTGNGNDGRAGKGVTFTVKEVVDGDTMILSDGSKIRLIGINTPEYGMYFFEEARETLQVMVLGREVSLEKDVSEMDKYGRLLRYAYMNDLFVNLEMVIRGFANAYTYPPDVKYSDKFLEAERYARENNLGVWQKSDSASIEILINYNAKESDNINLNGEYVIIKNTGTDIINTYGWTIKDSATNIYKFNKYLFKPDEAIYLFTGNGKDGEGKFYWGSPGPVWNNDHDALYLRDREGLLIEIYGY